MAHKLLRCFQERRWPHRFVPLKHWFCRVSLKSTRKRYLKLQETKPDRKTNTGKNLLAVPVGKEGKPFLARYVEKFGHENFDYLVFVWDTTRFDEEIFKGCQFIYEKGLKWYFMKKYVTPFYCRSYDYIFAWDDDFDARGFCPKAFLDLMRRHCLEMAQPALVGENIYHELTRKQEGMMVRFVDFVEIMAPVFSKAAWSRWWYMMENEYNFWGYGYDLLARSFCGFRSMGIVDSQPIRHMKPFRPDQKRAIEEEQIFLKKYASLKRAEKICYDAKRLEK